MTTFSSLDADALADTPVGGAITVRGKTLAADATVADARALFVSGSVLLIPILDGGSYMGAVVRAGLPDEAADHEPIAGFATAQLPTIVASARLGDALGVLELDGGRRLVVLDEDLTTFVGLLCLSGDRKRLCIDAECHGDPARADAG